MGIFCPEPSTCDYDHAGLKVTEFLFCISSDARIPTQSAKEHKINARVPRGDMRVEQGGLTSSDDVPEGGDGGTGGGINGMDSLRTRQAECL